MNIYTFLDSRLESFSPETIIEAPNLGTAQIMLNIQKGVAAHNYKLESIEWLDKVGEPITEINNLFLPMPNNPINHLKIV